MLKIKGGGEPVWRGPAASVTEKVTKKPIALSLRKALPVSKEVRAAVEKIERRGRPKSGKALSTAERVAAYRARRRTVDIWADFAETVAADG